MAENEELQEEMSEGETRQKILVADDEASIRRILETRLKMVGYDVVVAEDGEEAVDVFNKTNPDLVVLDVMMPKMDGYGVTREIRRSSDVPIIILTALGDVSERITGLELGADDYVTKPFNPVELQARVKSQLRRYLKLGGGSVHDDLLVMGGISLNDRAKEVTLDGVPVQLTKTEYDILKFLMQNPGEAFSPQKIYQKVWKGEPFGTENTVAVHIRHLREKIEYDPANPRYLIAVWGRGYKMEDGGRK